MVEYACEFDCRDCGEQVTEEAKATAIKSKNALVYCTGCFKVYYADNGMPFTVGTIPVYPVYLKILDFVPAGDSNAS